MKWPNFKPDFDNKISLTNILVLSISMFITDFFFIYLVNHSASSSAHQSVLKLYRMGKIRIVNLPVK